MIINIEEEKGKQGLNGLIKITKNKEDIINRLYKEGKIRRIGEGCYSVPSECFVLGITPSLVNNVLDTNTKGDRKGKWTQRKRQ